jgi:hypothetical protein
MKTQLKHSLYVFILLTVIAATAKAQSNSSRRHSVIDSLQITNPDEVKLCTLWDDAITEYIRRMQILLADPSKLKSADNDKIDKQFSDASKELQPQMKSLENTLKTNTAELMKFEQFSMYESRRLMPVMQQYQRIKMSSH